MFKVAGPLWAQAAAGGDNVFARLVKTGKKVLRRVFQATEPAVGQREIPKPTWSLRAQTIQFSESCTGRLVGGLFPKQVLKTQAAEARRRAALRLIRDSRKVPVFAFVGLSLGACSEFKNDHDHDALCSGIRDLFRQHAVKQSGVDEAGQQFSLETLQLGSLIGKGCNAAVYEARPAICCIEELACVEDKGHAIEESPTPNISIPVPVPEMPSDDPGSSVDPSEDDLPPAVFHTDEGTSNSEDSEDDFVIISEDDEDTKEFGTGNDISLSPTSHDCDGWMMYRVSESSEIGTDFSDADSDIFILAGDEEGLVSVPDCEDLGTVWMNLDSVGMRDHSSFTDSSCSLDPSVSTELSTSYSLISLGSVESSLTAEDSEPESSTSRADWACNENDYPLAVKMMFNYSVESQADRILTAMARETVPVSTALTEKGFALNSLQLGIRKLPPHPNIVTMHGVFVDNTPDLPGAAELYPSALPPRINNEGGLGRNATMFLVMKKYSMTLREYLSATNVDMRTRCLLFAQLLEGILHLGQHGIAHRDLKSDNILINLSHGEDQPFLVISDFGSCLADERYGLLLPYVTMDLDRGGNCALMAPEIRCAYPGPESVLDYTKADLWAAGALAYEIFGERNPFYHHMDSRTYSEDHLPKLHDGVPAGIQELISRMLKRDPSQRPSNVAAATAVQLFLWAPSSLHPLTSHCSVTSRALWKLQELSIWLEQVTLATVCQRVFGSCISPLENFVKTAFLSRVSRSSFASVVALDS